MEKFMPRFCRPVDPRPIAEWPCSAVRLVRLQMASIDPTLSRDRLLYEVAADLTSSLDLDEVLRRVLDKVIDLMNASRGYVVLVEEGILRVRVARTETGISEGTEFSGSRPLLGARRRGEEAARTH